MAMRLDSVWAAEDSRERFNEMVCEVMVRATEAFPGWVDFNYVMRIAEDGRPWVRVVRVSSRSAKDDVLVGSVYYDLNSNEVIVWREARNRGYDYSSLIAKAAT